MGKRGCSKRLFCLSDQRCQVFYFCHVVWVYNLSYGEQYVVDQRKMLIYNPAGVLAAGVSTQAKARANVQFALC